MSKVVNFGYTDTPIQGVSTLSLGRGLINYGADYRIVTSGPSEEVLTNLTCPIDRPETFRFGYTSVADVYKGTQIDSSVFAPSRRGVSVLAQLTEVASVTDSVDTGYRVDLPVSAHLVLKIPANENITAEMVKTVVGRLISGLFDTGSESVSRIQSLLRGSLTPSDL